MRLARWSAEPQRGVTRTMPYVKEDAREDVVVWLLIAHDAIPNQRQRKVTSFFLQHTGEAEFVLLDTRFLLSPDTLHTCPFSVLLSVLCRVPGRNPTRKRSSNHPIHILLRQHEERLQATILPPLRALQEPQEIQLMKAPHEPRLNDLSLLLPLFLPFLSLSLLLTISLPLTILVRNTGPASAFDDRRKGLEPIVEINEFAGLEVACEEDRGIGEGGGVVGGRGKRTARAAEVDVRGEESSLEGFEGGRAEDLMWWVGKKKRD
jgi:hypothetical protein